MQKAKSNVITVSYFMFIFTLIHASYTSLWPGAWFFFSMPVQSLTPGCQIHSYLHCLTPTACLNVNYKETEAETWREIFLQLSFLDYCVLFFTRVFHLPLQCPVISFVNLLVFRSAICSVSNQLLTTLLYPF